jgi:hypothetical protein
VAHNLPTMSSGSRLTTGTGAAERGGRFTGESRNSAGAGTATAWLNSLTSPVGRLFLAPMLRWTAMSRDAREGEPSVHGRLGVWAGLGVALIAGVALATLAGARVRIASLERPPLLQDDRGASLSRRLASMDAAIAHGDRSRAIYEWHDAYALAVWTRQWEPMATVGDAALRIDALAGDPTGFRAEARQAYLLALFRARDARTAEGVARVAEAFDALGDTEATARARAILVKVLR